MARYRAAVIACGRMSRAHAHAYRSIPEISLVACADIAPEALQAFGDEFSVPAESRYLDYREMLDQVKPDIVSICSLHHLHASMTIDAAEYRPKAIFCEKPIALSLAEADAMIDACDKADARLIIGHQRRYNPQYLAAKHAIEEGAIGTLQVIEAHGHPGCSLLVDGTHTVDLLRWYVEESPVQWVIGQIDAREGRSAWGSQVENAALALIRFTNGVRAILTQGHLLSDQTDPLRDPLWNGVPGGTYHQIILRGTEGSIEIDGDRPFEGQPWVRLVRSGEQQAVPLPSFSESSHVRLVRDLLHSVEQGKPHPLDAISARATLEVLIAVYASSQRRRIIEFPVAERENPLFSMLAEEVLL